MNSMSNYLKYFLKAIEENSNPSYIAYANIMEQNDVVAKWFAMRTILIHCPFKMRVRLIYIHSRER